MPAPTPSISVDDVRRYVDDQVFRPPDGDGAEGRVGIELEWIVRGRDGSAPIPPESLATLLPPVLPGQSRITFEPGGQLELSGPAGHDLAGACQGMRADTAVVHRALDRAGSISSVPGSTRGERFRVCSTPRGTEPWRSTSTPAGPRVAP